jgi:hypothetical protein
MFRLLKLTPPHGWSAVAWELAIVTLGVLIALGAQEVAQSFHWRSEVRETRGALDAELSRDLAAFHYRMDESACITARATELQRWAESFRTAKPLKLKHEIISTPGFAIRTEVWDIIDSEVASRIPLKDRLNYSGIYSGMRGVDNLGTQEGEAWEAIAEFDGATTLEEPDIRKIVLAAKALAGNNQILPAWDTTMSRQARELGLKPDPNLLKTANAIIPRMREAACESYL